MYLEMSWNATHVCFGSGPALGNAGNVGEWLVCCKSP